MLLNVLFLSCATLCRLAAPKEYLQFDNDQLDQNAPVNKAGLIVGKYSGVLHAGTARYSSTQHARSA